MGILANIGRILLKLGEPRSGQITNEDIEIIKKLLKFIAQGGLFGGVLAVLGIGIASFYAGWIGMAVIMLLAGYIMFVLGSKELNNILNPNGVKKRIAWEIMLLASGLLLVAVALMGLIDHIGNNIPRPSPDHNWVVEGAVGLVLTIAGLLWVKARQK
ncbi:MAG: hypothetical protein NTX52_05225 [Planctomycetota bacterium]|nr:hypothetical protein [Planctomycetota bacterium]